MTTAPHQPFLPPPPRRRTWPWVVGIIIGLLLFSCIGCIGILAWTTKKGPDPWVLTGGEIKLTHIQTMKDVGALEDGEQIHYFYSDAIVDIRKGFYFLSDRRVVVYRSGTAPSLTSVPIEDIVTVDLVRDESFFFDSKINLELVNGRPVAFPVSSTNDGDEKFFEAIDARITAKDD